jgi:trehalose 6-phosphate phosphatase
MRPILGEVAQPFLGELARARALLAFDFDGTLAPIVPNRRAAALRPETHRLLRALALLYPCAVISGRSRADVLERLAGLPLLAVVGNHGAEAGFGPLDRASRDQLLAWREALQSALGGAPGVEIEDKRFSIALHYRHAPVRATARRHVLAAARALEPRGARVFGGRAVVNVAPADAPDKGTAIEELLARVGRRPVLYVGDDRTDEDVFAGGSVDAAVRVGCTGRSAAAWYVPNQLAVDALLEALLEARIRLDGLAGHAGAVVDAAGA